MDQSVLDQSKIPEAVASVTYSLLTPNGFNILLTVRADSDVVLFERMGGIEEMLLNEGYQTDSRGNKKVFVTQKYQAKEDTSKPTSTQEKIIKSKAPEKWTDSLTREEAGEIVKGFING